MILVGIKGGLGNQIFQWAFGENLSLKHDVYYQNSCDSHNPRGDRSFDLNNILIRNVNLANNETLIKFQREGFEVIQDDHYYKDFNLDLNKNYLFDGYWQCEDYFSDSKDQILNSFKFPNTGDFDFKDSCSIHVRRGDYLNLQHLHHVLPISYYEKALSIINPSGKIYVFSDDIAWCRDHFSFNKMIFMEGNDCIQDLSYMSSCTHNIIANSTFSWWGAYLNRNKNKKVVAPNKWFNDNTNSADYNLDTWSNIDSKDYTINPNSLAPNQSDRNRPLIF